MTPEQAAEKYADNHEYSFDVHDGRDKYSDYEPLKSAFLAGHAHAQNRWVYIVQYQYDPVCDCGHKSEPEILGVFTYKQMAIECAISNMSDEKKSNPNIYKEVYDKEDEETDNPLWIKGFLCDVNVYRYDLQTPQPPDNG